MRAGLVIANYLVRYLFFAIGIFLMSIGIALTVHAGLGTTPISSIPAVLAVASPLSFGTWTALFNVALVILQIVLLRRCYPLFQLLQLPASFLFGALCDLSLWLTRGFTFDHYGAQALVSLAGTVVLGIGVWTQITPKVLNLAGEGAVIAVSTVVGKVFGKVKVVFDWTLVGLAVASSLLLMGRVEAVREGTLVSAVLVGILVRLFSRKLPFLARWTQPLHRTGQGADS